PAGEKYIPPSSSPCGQLLYPGFSVVWFDVFQLEAGSSLPKDSDGFIRPILDDDLDPEIFDQRFLKREVMNRFHLDGFRISLVIDGHEASPSIQGEVHVRATKYFDETVCV